MRRHIPPAPEKIAASQDAFAPPEYLAQAMIDGVDLVAHAMERKWGIDRLRLLVNDLLRAKFDAQAEKFNAAIQSQKLELIKMHAEGMKRAWQALDKAATETGQKPISADVWEVKLPNSGKIVAIVRTSAEAHLVASPDRETWTISEIAHLIDGAGNMVAEIKRTFPGAEITAIHKTDQTQSQSFDWKQGDEIPF